MKTGFFYVYILRSEAEPPHFYTGFTEDLEARLQHHNSGGEHSEAAGGPLAEAMHHVYLLRSLAAPQQTYIGLTDDMRARLKSHNSGGDRPSEWRRFEPTLYQIHTRRQGGMTDGQRGYSEDTC